MNEQVNAIKAEIDRHFPRMNGWCPPDKALWLVRKIMEDRPLSVVEIGVFAGKSLWSMGLAMEQANKDRPEQGYVLGIDPFTPVHAEEYKEPEHRDWWRKIDFDSILRECLERIKPLQQHCGLLRAASQDVAALFGSIDLLHIDGCHSEESSVRDVELWLPKVREGGVVVFDDVNWASVKKALGMIREKCFSIFKTQTWEAFRKGEAKVELVGQPPAIAQVDQSIESGALAPVPLSEVTS